MFTEPNLYKDACSQQWLTIRAVFDANMSVNWERTVESKLQYIYVCQTGDLGINIALWHYTSTRKRLE